MLARASSSRPHRLGPDELDTKEVMLLARDRPDRGLDPPAVMACDFRQWGQAEGRRYDCRCA